MFESIKKTFYEKNMNGINFWSFINLFFLKIIYNNFLENNVINLGVSIIYYIFFYYSIYQKNIKYIFNAYKLVI